VLQKIDIEDNFFFMFLTLFPFEDFRYAKPVEGDVLDVHEVDDVVVVAVIFKHIKL
jgi:hypothetical protein